MNKRNYECCIIGGGASGIAAAIALDKAGVKTALIERDPVLGGILNQCIHPGFGLHYFKETLTGPEFAEKLIIRLEQSDVDVFTGTTVSGGNWTNGERVLYACSPEHGLVHFHSRSAVLAMGCRERNRGNIGIPGTRPAGIYTAGTAQRFVNMEGIMPGHNVLIVGSGDIGLIMARRMIYCGAKVHGVVEIQPYPAGLTRNIVQCLNDFNIPLHLNHVVTEIYGKERVEGVQVSPLEYGIADKSQAFSVPCDTLLLSVGLVPENEVSRKLGVPVNPETNGAFVDSHYMTKQEGIFACGNVLHVHDLVDYAANEGEACAAGVISFLQNQNTGEEYRLLAGKNVRYVIPNTYNTRSTVTAYLRPMVVKNKAVMTLRKGNKVIKTRKLAHIQPSEMITFSLPEIAPPGDGDVSRLTIEIE